MIWSFVNRFELCRRGGVLVLLALALLAFGCGSSEQTATPTQNAGKTDLGAWKPDDLYRIEGSGRNKRKVAVSRRERMKAVHEAAKNPESK
jgi:hypothetical protein